MATRVILTHIQTSLPVEKEKKVFIEMIVSINGVRTNIFRGRNQQTGTGLEEILDRDFKILRVRVRFEYSMTSYKRFNFQIQPVLWGNKYPIRKKTEVRLIQTLAFNH